MKKIITTVTSSYHFKHFIGDIERGYIDTATTAAIAYSMGFEVKAVEGSPNFNIGFKKKRG